MLEADQFRLGLYVHWPFCEKRCPYCDFNVHELDPDQPTDQARWAVALSAELRHFAPLAQERRLTSIFFGGGTPSLMAPETVKPSRHCRREIGFLNNIEITLEANPTSADAERFAGYRAAGVNRLSLGIQSLRPDALLALWRQHSVDEALAALELARSAFHNLSFDLMYARPRQDRDDWADELDQALALRPDHISLYQLTIEPNTIFEQLARKGIIRPKEDDETADFYHWTRQRLAQRGSMATRSANARPASRERAQPPLLGLSGLHRHRPGRPRSADHRRRQDRHPPAPRALCLAGPGRGAGHATVTREILEKTGWPRPCPSACA